MHEKIFPVFVQPGTTGRMIVVLTNPDRGIPALDNLAGGVALRKCVIALDPFRLDDVAAGRKRLLQVLSGKYTRPNFISTQFKNVERLAFGMQHLPNTP